jgi:methylisocitrate lyase
LGGKRQQQGSDRERKKATKRINVGSHFAVAHLLLNLSLCLPSSQNKQLVSVSEMVDRIQSAVSGRTDPDFVIMARTDALASEGLERAIERAKAYVEAGADMLFPDACHTLEEYKAFQAALSQPNYHKDVPILANITEFGKTPLFTTAELGSSGVSMVLYPLSAFRAMVSAARGAKTSTQAQLTYACHS